MRETTKCTLKKKTESAWPKQGLLKLGTFYLKNMYSVEKSAKNPTRWRFGQKLVNFMRMNGKPYLGFTSMEISN